MIRTQLHNDIFEIVMLNAPVNALSAPLRQGLVRALTEAQDNPAVKAIVIRGDGKLFSGGADITEFGQLPIDPMLPDVAFVIEESGKPVIAAVHGIALGGGLEVAIASHYRVVTPDAKLGLPEVTLGLLPGAGGTQRLPRLIGAEAALGMIVSGVPISGSKGAEIGLVDKLATEGDLAAEAIAFARTVDGPRRTGHRVVAADNALFDRFASDNARTIKGLDAPQACIEAVKAATHLSIKDGQELESALFAKLVEGGQSRALRHVFFAERAAAKVDGLPKDTGLRPIAKVGIIGAGTMGGGIAMNFLSRGIPVTIVETAQTHWIAASA